MESYIITIFDGTASPVEVDLSQFRKSTVTFGRSESNDIVLHSSVVSRRHGMFRLSNGQICVEDSNSTNGIVINGVMVRNCVLHDGDILRIDDYEESVREGVLFLLKPTSAVSAWKSLNLTPGNRITIGREQGSTFHLKHVGVSKRHAVIDWVNGIPFICDLNSTNGTFVNGFKVSGKRRLQEKDIIIVTNNKMIFTTNCIYYCTYLTGFGIDAQNIVQTVRSHGKTFNICNEVSLQIAPGELVAIIGGSGAGKTTFMNAISGYAKPTSGKVFINGEELYETYDALKNIIGYVPQQDIVYDNLTLFDMLDYAAKLRLPDDVTAVERRNRVHEVVNMVELSGKDNTMIRRLSGGQKKRASIAVELLSDPNLFFLDEPASGLDPGTERNLMRTLKKMTQNGKTIVLVTHSTLNLQECDKIIFMGKGGNLCFCGNMKEAESFFEVDNLVDVYNMITDNSDYWKRKYCEYQDRPEITPASNSGVKSESRKSFNKHSWLRQIGVLSSRYGRLLFNDRQRLLLLLLQAPILGLLISLVEDGKQFEYFSMTKSLLFALSCSAFWIGILNAIQEVCKERTILRREYMTGLHLSSYITSKFLVLGFLCLIQSAMLITVFVCTVGKPEEGVQLNAYMEMLITTFLTSFSAAAMGLFASSLFKNPDRAMTVAPILLMPQILFSGLLFELSGVTKTISWFAICRWSMEGYGTIANLNALKYAVEVNGEMMEIEREAEGFFTYTWQHLCKDFGILILFVVGFAVLSVLVLRNIRRQKV